MKIIETKIPDIVIFNPNIYQDARGSFAEIFVYKDFENRCGNFLFVQDNYSKSIKNTLRGMHYQIRREQGKLITCANGEVFDVAVDIRKDSPTYTKYVSAILSDKNKNTVWIPPGFAHGFFVLSDIAEIEYKCTNYYSKENERGIRWNDPTININWPIPEGIIPILSEKDSKLKFIGEDC
jgi:dTDP-4-dehydrorhamnose 3,5-epimerase